MSTTVMQPERLIAALDRRLARRSGWLILACLMAIAALPTLFLNRLQGDEYAYTAAARVIADYLRGDADAANLLLALVGDGHFMPGPALLTAPLFVAFPDPAVWLQRAWWGAIMVLLWLWSVAEARRHLGPPFTMAAVIFPAATVSWHMMAATANGDVAAGLLLLIAFARTYGLCRALIAGGSPSLKAIIALEIVLALMICMRGPTILLAAVMHAGMFAAALLGRAPVVKSVFAVFLGAGLLTATMIPWMLATKRVLGEPLLTTSTLPLSLAYTFGDRDRLCFGACPSGNIWHVMPEFSREEAQRLGTSALAVQRRMADHALQGLTVKHYFGTVRGNFVRFVTGPTQATETLVTGSFRLPEQLKPTLRTVIRAIDWPIYAIFLLTLLAANLLIVRTTLEHQIVSLAIKAMTLAIFVQPFMHPGHGRYWPVFAPLMALSAGHVLTVHTRQTQRATSGVGILTALQSVHVAAVLATACVLAMV
jgi:hypothetical protein